MTGRRRHSRTELEAELPADTQPRGLIPGACSRGLLVWRRPSIFRIGIDVIQLFDGGLRHEFVERRCLSRPYVEPSCQPLTSRVRRPSIGSSVNTPPRRGRLLALRSLNSAQSNRVRCLTPRYARPRSLVRESAPCRDPKTRKLAPELHQWLAFSSDPFIKMLASTRPVQSS